MAHSLCGSYVTIATLSLGFLAFKIKFILLSVVAKVVIDKKQICEYGLRWKPPTLGIGKQTLTFTSSHVIILCNPYEAEFRFQLA